MTKVVLSANTDWYLYNFRLALAQAIRDAGASVLLLSPSGPYVEKLEKEGFRWKPLKMSRRGLNPFAEFATLLNFISHYRSEQPDLVHHFTIKPVLYGSLAARILGIPAVVNAVTGLGYIFVNPGRLAAFLRVLVKPFYRIALPSRQSKVVFQNQRDRDVFVHEGLVPADRAVIIAGSGVDPDRFKPGLEAPGDPVILLASRMLWDKGIAELIEAVGKLRLRGLAFKTVLVGGVDEGYPASVPEEYLKAWQEEGIIEWLGHQDDMPRIMANAHIVVLPSYGEGLPRVLIEACAAGKAVVTTDVPGCRDIIEHGVNGLLVQPRDALALADALGQLVLDEQMRKDMGKAGRKIMLERYTSDHINRLTFDVYQEIHPGEFLWTET